MKNDRPDLDCFYLIGHTEQIWHKILMTFWIWELPDEWIRWGEILIPKKQWNSGVGTRLAKVHAIEYRESFLFGTIRECAPMQKFKFE